MKNTKLMIVIAALLAGLGTNAQTSAKAVKDHLTKKKTDSLVSHVCSFIRDNYFDINKGKQLQQLLNQKLTSGKFYNLPVDTITRMMTILLRNETHDIHFFVGTKAYLRRREINNRKPENYNGGFVDVRILPGNIGYIKYVRCIADSAAYSKIADAMNFLTGCGALILDISENPGGDGSSCGFINAFLYPGEDYKHLLIKTCRNSKNEGETSINYGHKITDYFKKLPIYMMISKNTGSAAEYFAFMAQQLKRAKLLGQTTAGAANPVSMIEFDEYVAAVPICQITTTDGKSFEGKGVIPDIQLTSNDWLKETIDYISKNDTMKVNVSDSIIKNE